MKNLIVTILLVLALSGSVRAVNVLEPGYTVQTYASYSDAESRTYSMVFDDAGNLYLG